MNTPTFRAACCRRSTRCSRRLGYIDPAAIPVIAAVFNLSVAEVHGVISFYKDFRTSPPNGPIVQVCRAEACQARGACRYTPPPFASWRPAPPIEARGRVLPRELCPGPVGGDRRSPPWRRRCRRSGGHRRPRLAAHSHAATADGVAADSRMSWPAPTSLVSSRGDSTQATITVYVPRDAAARSAGADEVADGVRLPTGRAGRAQRIARHALARADDRGRDDPTAASPTGRCTPTTSRPPRGRRARRAATTRCGSARPTRSPGCAGSSGSRSGGSASSTRARPTTTSATAGSAGLRRALAMPPGDVVAEVTAVRPARSRRGGVPHRHQVAHRARRARPHEVRHLQRRRGRQRHVRRPHAHRGRSVHADRGDGHRRLCRRAPVRATSTSAPSTPTRSKRCDAAIAAAEGRGWLGDDVLGSGFAFRIARARRRRRVHLR